MYINFATVNDVALFTTTCDKYDEDILIKQIIIKRTYKIAFSYLEGESKNGRRKCTN